VRKQRRFDTAERTDFDDDPLYRTGAAIGGNIGNLCQERLANGQFMHHAC
jgi:hypothetical protein